MRASWMLWMPMLAVAGCTKLYPDSGDTDTDANADTDISQDTNGDGQCDATAAQILPLDGSLGVGVDEDITVTFTYGVAARDLTITLATEAGTPVTSSYTLSTDGLTASVAHDTLQESTNYVLTATSCTHVATAAFQTTAGPVDATIEQRVYALDYSTVTWVEPAWASSLSGMLGLQYVLVKVLSYDDALQELDAAGGIGFTDPNTGEIAQGACYSPMNYLNVDFSQNPSFEVGPSDLAIPQQNFTVYGLDIQAAFAENGDALVGIDMSGQIDSRQVIANTGIDPCQLATLNGDTCRPCASDGATACLNLYLTADRAPYVPGVVFNESYDPAGDTRCP